MHGHGQCSAWACLSTTQDELDPSECGASIAGLHVDLIFWVFSSIKEPATATATADVLDTATEAEMD